MSNTLSEQLAFISLDSFSQGGLGFYFFCRSCLVKGANLSISLKLLIPISNLKLKQMVSLTKPFTLMVGVHLGCPFSMLLYIGAAVKYLQFSLMLTRGS